MHEIDRHIRIQSLTKLKRGLLCLRCPKQSWKSLLGALIALKIAKN